MLEKANNGVFAIIVTYNADDGVIDNIKALAPQVQEMVVVDNGAAQDCRSWMKFCSENGINVILNEKNLGIAKALNIGAEYGCKKGYDYILTMDQDSKMEEGSVDKLLSALKSDVKLASVGVNYENRQSKELIYKQLLITSGNLTKTEVYKQVKGFNDDLFIDCVDFDFSLKIVKAGYKLAIVPDAKMNHRLGEKKTVRCLFFRKEISEHSPTRYYYMYRNHKYIVAKYRKDFPLLCMKKSVMQTLHTIEVILFHSMKKEKLRAIKKGKKDSKILIKETTSAGKNDR